MGWLAAELLEIAESATGLESWRLVVLDTLRQRVPWDDTFWGSPPSSSDREGVFRCVDPTAAAWTQFFAAPDRYRLPIAMQRTWQTGGVGIDTDILSREQLDRAAIYAEILRPLGVRTTMTVIPTFRGLPSSCIGFTRHDRAARFRPAERAFMLEAVKAIGVVEMAFRSERASEGAPDGCDRLELLSRRERQVATFVAQGFSNKEVAALLGTSVNTVRNQTVRIYAKLRTGGRAQLARLLAGERL
jgi:DNA-binding CsgD family transcriptional regulator